MLRCARKLGKLIDNLKSTAEKMRSKEVAEEEGKRRIQETFERKKKETKEKEDALNQVERRRRV